MLRGVRIPTSRPPSCRTHSITMRVGPGGEHTYSIRIVRTADPSPRVGTGTLRVRPPWGSVPPCAGRPAPHLDKGVGVMEEMCKAQVAVGAGSKMAPRDRASAL